MEDLLFSSAWQRPAQIIPDMDEYHQQMEWFSGESELEDRMWVGDLYARKQTSKKRQAKEEALHGVEDSDSHYGDSGKRPRRGEAGSVGPAFGMFTKGIGSKLLEKMGYKGGGLGKNQQGIAKPIEVKLRPKNMGMGFDEFRESTPVLRPSPEMLPPDEEVVVEKPKSKEKLWMKENTGEKKAALRTAAELIAEREAQNGGIFQQTVLDMRGPQPRLFTNWKSLNAEQTAIEDNTPMPELQHNLRLIVDMTEAEIHTCNQRLQNERDTVLILNKDRERLETAVCEQGKQIAAMEAVMSSLEQIRRQVAEGGMNLENLANAFARIKYSYREEYKLFSIGIIALSFSLPLMSNLFRGWQPFLQPQHGIEAMAAWQELLQGKEADDLAIFQDVDNSPYLQLVLEVIFPHLRWATTNVWHPRDPEPILRFLEAWDKVLPAGVKQSLLEGVVMPKLTAAVDAWDPRLEEVPIHAWLHPWLPWLGTRMAHLYVPIRYKLKVALVNRHPGDPSILALLSPWKTVFDPVDWELLIARSTIPQPACGAAHVQLQKQHAAFDMEEDGSREENLMSLKEAVVAFARENDVQFTPKPGRTYEGLQVYIFGAVSVVLDYAKQSILAQTGNGWNAVCLEQVLEMHRSRGGSQ